VRKSAEKILTKIEIGNRIFDAKYHKVMDNNGNVIYKGPNAKEK